VTTATTEADRPRLVFAALVAPLATVPTLTLLTLLTGDFDITGPTKLWELVSTAAPLFALFGLPIAYAVEIVVLVIALAVGASPRTVDPRDATLGATLAGVSTGFLGWVVLDNDATPAIWLGLSTVLGLASGLTFVVVRDGVIGLRRLLTK
jgi:hypothetical protein